MKFNTQTELDNHINAVVAECINRNFSEQNAKIIFEEINPYMNEAFPELSDAQKSSLRNIIWNIMRISAKLAVDSALEADAAICNDMKEMK